MSQQFHNGGHHAGSITVSIRDTYDYAVVNWPGEGKWRKPQDAKSIQKRRDHWRKRRAEAGIGKAVYS